MCGALSDEMSVNVAPLAKLAWGGQSTAAMRTSRIEIMRKMVVGYPRRRVQVVIMFLALFMTMNKTGKGTRSAYADATGGIGRCEQQKSVFSIINISQYPCLGRDLSS